MSRRDPNRPASDANLEHLLIEAGVTAANWRLEPYRAHAAQEAHRCYLPGPDRLGMGKFLMAMALRQTMSSLMRLKSEAAREHIAVAMRALAAAVRAEPAIPEPSKPAVSVRNYWNDRE